LALNHDDLLIIGAGPAGLALSYAFPGKSRILEQRTEVGGLCCSIEFGGGVFDIGGHCFHSPHPEVLELVQRLMIGRWHTQRRDARVSFNGELIGYPFQQHFQDLSDRTVVADCLRNRPSTKANARADNFEDWIIERFGQGVARHFMLPYNRKLWARDLRRISCEWVSERVAGNEKDSGVKKGGARQPLESDSQIGYPAEGGFGEIFQAMAKSCGPVEFGKKIRFVNATGKTVHAEDGGVWGWNCLASTMPLPALLRAIQDCPTALIGDADRLEFVSLKVLLILIGKGLGDEPQRVYVADPQVPAHKIAFNHTSSASLRSRPSHAIMCEISYSSDKQIAPDADLARTMIDWLVDSRLVLSRNDVVETRIIDIEYGYPVYTHDRPRILERIRAYLGKLDIHTIGRFGGWSYVNSDACIYEGLALARKIHCGLVDAAQA
jgi:protoporphyrinogen oxidase